MNVSYPGETAEYRAATCGSLRGGNTCQRDYLAETDCGAQLAMRNVFRRDGGEIRHVWGSELLYAPTEPGQDPRHNDAMDPLWNLFDRTPAGAAPTGSPALSYD